MHHHCDTCSLDQQGDQGPEEHHHSGHHHHHGHHQAHGGAALVLALWSLGWKAAAVTVALRKDDKKWVLPLALLNTGGILPIVYLLANRES